ncbi:MAG: hypothetical protein WBG50_08445 [Desulfomonilaceae bacterium]
MLQKTWILMLVLALVGLMSWLPVSEAATQAPQAPSSRGLAAVDRAAKAHRHLFILFYRQNDAQTQRLTAVFDNAVAALGGQADSIAIPIAEPSEAGFVAKFGVKEAPMPLAMVLAPNGAITAGFPGNFTKEQLLGSLATPAMEKLLGALQHGKMVFLCLQNGGTRENAEAMSGIRAFRADQQYAAATEVLMLDPSLPAERPFLTRLGINGPVNEAMTLLIAPPGSIIGSFKGATDKNRLVASVAKASKGCCGAGCKPGQCGH